MFTGLIGVFQMGFKVSHRCPKCHGEMQTDKEDYFCVVCDYRRPRVYTYAGEGKAVLRHKQRLGASLTATLGDAYEKAFEPKEGEHYINSQYRNRLYSAMKRQGQAISRNPKERREHRWITEQLPRHPQIRQWLTDHNVNQTVRDNVELLHSVLLGDIQGWRPEYLFSVLCHLVYDAHDLLFDPPNFIENVNFSTYWSYYKRVCDLLRKKGITHLRTPQGNISFKF